jgi:hypothetical protein
LSFGNAAGKLAAFLFAPKSALAVHFRNCAVALCDVHCVAAAARNPKSIVAVFSQRTAGRMKYNPMIALILHAKLILRKVGPSGLARLKALDCRFRNSPSSLLVHNKRPVDEARRFGTF